MIVTWFALRVQNGNENYATVNEIARGLNMSPSSHLVNILHEMMLEYKLTMRGVQKPGRWFGHEYMLEPGTYEHPKRRAIPVKARGVVSAQLEMFE